MTASQRRVAPLDLAAGAYAATYFLWMAAKVAGIAVPAFVGDVAFYPLGLAIGWANWRNSRVPGLDARTRLAWRLLALAALVLWASGTAWSVWLALGWSVEWADRIDRLAFAQYVLAMSGYLAFPGRAFPRRGGARLVLDVALIAIAGFVLAYYAGATMLLHDPANPPTLAVVESSFDWALFVVAAIGCMQKRDGIVRRVLILLLASTLVSLGGNYLHTVAREYHSGDPLDTLWFSAWVLRWIAARLAWHHYRAVGAGSASDSAPVQHYRSNPFAYVLVGAAFLLLFVQILGGTHQLIGMLTVSSTVLACLLILRQFAELEENRRLFRAQIEGERRFRSLVHNSSDVVVVVDDTGVVSYVSPSAATVFGDDANVRPGVPLRQLLAPEDAAVAEALVEREPHAPARFEASMQVAPARRREIEAVWSDLRDDPAVRGILINCRDVSDRNEVERHLRQTQKLDAVGHLAGGLAHDLNNVLSIIRGYAELLRSELPDQPAGRTDLVQIMSAVDRAAAVTRKVLAFSRKQPGEMKRVDLNVVVRDLEPMLRHMMKDQVEVRLELARDVWPVRGDAGQMEQVVVNLATNARDAMPRGGVIRIATENRGSPTGAMQNAECRMQNADEQLAVLRLGADAPRSGQAGEDESAGGIGDARRDYVALVVSDDGIGMSEEVAARIFEPFFSTKPKDQALGLGLSIVHGIVTEMGGRVLVKSAEGRGSTFTVLLPRA